MRPGQQTSCGALLPNPSYDCLADLKFKLASSVNEGVSFVHRAVDEDDNAGVIVFKVIDNAVAAMNPLPQCCRSQSLELAIAALADAGRRSGQGRRIKFYGVGSSGTVAQDGRRKLIRLGVTATAIGDGNTQVRSAAMR